MRIVTTTALLALSIAATAYALACAAVLILYGKPATFGLLCLLIAFAFVAAAIAVCFAYELRDAQRSRQAYRASRAYRVAERLSHMRQARRRFV